MNLQFISDSTGETTGVYIPIKEWNELKSKFKEIEQVEIDIPEWHKDIVRQRLADYKKNPGQAMDFDTAMDDIESTL
jgi:phosphorylcholine metabolism protein LicD